MYICVMVSTYQKTRCHNPEGHNLHHCEKPQISYIKISMKTLKTDTLSGEERNLFSLILMQGWAHILLRGDHEMNS